MQNPRLRLVSGILVLSAGFSLAACSSGGKTAAKPRPVTSVPATPQSVPTKLPMVRCNYDVTIPATSPKCHPTVTVTVDPKVKQAVLSYLQSPERVNRFMSVVPQAGIRIAQALQAGKFGPVFRSNSAKVALQPGEVGYGGIQANNRAAFAWVYWNADGTIDYTKPILDIFLRNANNSAATEVSFFHPFYPVDSKYDFGTYWQVFKYLDKDTTEVNNTWNLDTRVVDTSTSKKKEPFYYPYNLQEFKDLDDVAFDQLNANLVSQFGS